MFRKENVMSSEAPIKGLEWANLVLGAILFLSPFVLGYTGTAAAAWNAYILGVIIVVVSVVALINFAIWTEWVNLVAGLWTLVAPFVLGFSTLASAMWVHVIVGVLVAVFAAVELFRSRDTSITAS
jgi:uncharacterized membrane protein YkgB